MTDPEELKKQLREKGSYAHTTMPPKPSIESRAVDAIEQLQRELEEARRLLCEARENPYSMTDPALISRIDAAILKRAES